MPFHQREFLFFLLPLFIVGVSIAGQFRVLAITIFSVLYVSLSGWLDIGFMVASVSINYLIAWILHSRGEKRPVFLFALICFNVASLFYGKRLLGGEGITIPLGISFYTFEQIAFHIDARKERFRFPTLLEYVFFVSYLPHLVAGPLIRAGDLFSQIRESRFPRMNLSFENVALLIIGLAKKVLIADGLAPFVDQAYSEASFADAHLGALHFLYATAGYGLQIYFDFSAYSDMALAMSSMVGIQLPINFNSPFKSRSIGEFWRRWHMSLSSFIREYLYDPLKGFFRSGTMRAVLVVSVMVLVGLWHGFSWSLAIWGGAHGALLSLNHLWSKSGIRFPPIIGSVVTMSCVYGLCLLFRGAEALHLQRLVASSLAFHGGAFSENASLAVVYLLVAGMLAHTAPNSMEIYRWIQGNYMGRPLAVRTAILSVFFVLAIGGFVLSDFKSSFIYYRF